MTNNSAEPDFQTMAELRYQIRRFLRFSEQAARRFGVVSQRHQLQLAVKGLPFGRNLTICVPAEKMQLQHHSSLELTERLVDRRFRCRLRTIDDRRQVLVKLNSLRGEFSQN